MGQADCWIEFQFQTGSIKSAEPVIPLVLLQLRFNSKLVRLKDGEVPEQVCHECLFQFQTGSIKSGSDEDYSEYKRIVSIPNWFD